MKFQVWFETDLGYAATKYKLLKSSEFIGDPSGDNCGRLTFHLKGLKDFTLQITTKGKVCISYPENSDYTIIIERLKPFLVKPDGSPIKSLKIKDHFRYGHTLFKNRMDYDVALQHSKSLVITSKDAETDFDQRMDQYGPDMILRIVLSNEVHAPLTAYDNYFLQHIKSGYPEICDLITQWKKASHQKEMQNVANLILEKIYATIEGVKLSKPLLGRCDCCP